jgi:predicted nucleic acid-binding protein
MNLFDSSAIFNLFLQGKYDTLVSGATVPLARYEIGNVLWKNYKIRKRISKKEAIEAGNVLFELIDSMEMVDPPLLSAIRIALEEGITFYDSSYVAAAIESGCDLITDDVKLREVAGSKVRTMNSTDLQ